MRLGTHRNGHIHAVAKTGRTFDQRMQHVIAVAGPGNRLAGDGTAMFFEGHQVGHDLAGMGVVCQRVDDRHGGMFGQFQKALVIGSADHDRVDITR
ncbi:hypothetical protein D3C71_563020 [compost metagenome]